MAAVVEVAEVAGTDDATPTEVVIDEIVPRAGRPSHEGAPAQRRRRRGQTGDIVEVAGGFARNHLLPAGKAIAASPGIEAQAAAMRRSRDLRDARDRESSETVARTLVGNTITLRPGPPATGCSARSPQPTS